MTNKSSSLLNIHSQNRGQNHLLISGCLLVMLILFGHGREVEAQVENNLVVKQLCEQRNQEGDFLNYNGHELTQLQACKRCHGGPLSSTNSIEEDTSTAQNPIIGQDLIRASTDGWFLGNEMTTWETFDKHAQAYVALESGLAQSMATLLGIVDEKGKSLIHHDLRCLACHSSIPVENYLTEFPDDCKVTGKTYVTVCAGLGNSAENNRSLKQVYGVSLLAGVSCEGCHGPAGDKKAEDNDGIRGWGNLHWMDENWRHYDSAKRYASGQWDVRSYVNRARICASCHIGNVRQGKIITHEMYAAGHPPLPNLEVATYSNQEPSHWNGFFDKSPELKTEYASKVLPDVNLEEVFTSTSRVAEQTTIMLVSGLMNMAEQLRLSADLLDPEVHSPLHQIAEQDSSIEFHSWPEFANYACFNCHHDLRTGTWRQSRKLMLKPGRPNIHEWPLASAKLASMYFNDVSGYEAQLKPLVQSLNAAPFGNPVSLMESSRGLADWLEKNAWELSHNPVSVEKLPELMTSICTLAEEERDYDSVRQLIWSYVVAYDEFMFLNSDMTARIIHRDVKESPLFAGWYDNQSNEITDCLRNFQEHVMLDLNRSRERKVLSIQGMNSRNDSPVNFGIYELDLSAVFPMISAYEAKELQTNFQKLKSLSEKLVEVQ
ncbi:hypothetical protein [Rubinisphaera italica]|uniref:Cytochrome c-552/4 domain-containing protein n=1 Tax=Rubinisphaera italica TaxID=2527969 RepID=A0A5C5XGH1_9PLAN|nr:hypothetical protein [Rubinisphaera italica]TWT61501.1 hypothetical protein Pan54_22370 [Rubinisphaera italica]